MVGVWVRAQFMGLWYLVRHRWFVFVECLRCGLVWRGLTHDLSKLRPSEWFPYQWSFYGPQPRSIETREKFNEAWLLHQHRNDHHWQYWVLNEDSGKLKILRMSDGARKEMVCDWKGAGRAQGRPNTIAWYEANRKRIKLHPETRMLVERQLGVVA